MIVKATDREEVAVHGLRFKFEPGEVQEIGPDELARAVLRASDLLVEVEPDPTEVTYSYEVDADSELVSGPYDGPHADILGDVDPRVASDDEILAVDGIGPARLEEIREALG